MNDQQPAEQLEQLSGQMTIEDTAPDPGNSGPDAWTDNLTDDEYDQAAERVNTIAVDLPPHDVPEAG